MQLAKACARGHRHPAAGGGMETADVARLYLCGRLRFRHAPGKRARIGPIPEELSDRVTVLGNALVPARCAMRPRKARPKAPSASSAVPGTSNFPPTRASPTPTWNGCSSRKGMRLERGKPFPANGTPARIAFFPGFTSFFPNASQCDAGKSVSMNEGAEHPSLGHPPELSGRTTAEARRTRSALRYASANPERLV